MRRVVSLYLPTWPTEVKGWLGAVAELASLQQTALEQWQKVSEAWQEQQQLQQQQRQLALQVEGMQQQALAAERHLVVVGRSPPGGA